MITRPLDLASKLRAEPRNFDVFFYVNVGLLALFFTLFGSRFVLAPGLGADFRIPVLPQEATATYTTSVISVKRNGQIFTNEGQLDMIQLHDWLKREASQTKNPVILIRADAGVTLADVDEIYNACHEAGFAAVQMAADRPKH